MAKKNFLKIISVIFFLCILSACTLKQAMQGYEKGDYVASIQVITNKLNQKQGYPRDSLKKSWLNVIDLSLNKLESLPANTLDQKIQRLEKIYQARQLVGSGFYANEFSGFNQRYPLQQINLDLAKLFYEKGNSIQLLTTESYRVKAEAYETGLQHANYLDMASLAAKYRKEYSTRLAADYYQLANQSAKLKNYKTASEYFSKALTAYKSYGEYKDARSQFDKYNKLWRTEEAASLFEKAALKERVATRKVDYREVARLYSEAADVYIPFGDYKNAAGLAKVARNKSIITVAYSIHQDRGDDYCGSAYSQRLSERFKAKLEAKFKGYPYQLTNSMNSDIKINIDYASYFKEGRLEERNQVQSIVDAQGSVWKFNQKNESRKNEYELKADIYTRGHLRINKSVSKQKDSEQINVIYSGNVPAGYKNKTEGSLKDRNGLCLDIIGDVERELDYALDDIARQALRL